jgi:hypothetical protein
MKLHFEIIPPEIYANANQEQDFSAKITSNQWQSINNSITGEIEQGCGEKRDIKVVGLNVSANDSRLGPNAPSSSLEKSLAEKGSKGGPSPPPVFKVPVMLHYEGGTIKLTAYSDDGKTHLWTKTLTYELPEEYFPKMVVNSNWKRIDNEHVECLLKPTEMALEKWGFIGQVNHYIRFSDDYLVTLDLGIQKVLNEKLEAMTYYIDRIYALRNVGVYLDKSLIN